jgi:Tfp pilus assembly protein FimV
MFGTALDFERVFVEHRAMHRTYVRRRLVALAAALGVVAALSGPISGALGVVGHEAAFVSSRTYVVRPGDTLWSIAASVSPHRDPREVIHDLDALNQAPVDPLRPGMVLTVPR